MDIITEQNEALAHVAKKGSLLQYVSDALKNNKKIVVAAVKQDGMALEYASDELKNDRYVLLESVKQNWRALQYASDNFKNDNQVVLAAIKGNGLAFQYASERLKNHRRVVLTAIKQDGNALEYASDNLKNDRETVLTAIKQNGLALQYASDDLKNDSEMKLIAGRRNHEIRTATIRKNFVDRKFDKDIYLSECYERFQMCVYNAWIEIDDIKSFELSYKDFCPSYIFYPFNKFYLHPGKWTMGYHLFFKINPRWRRSDEFIRDQFWMFESEGEMLYLSVNGKIFANFMDNFQIKGNKIYIKGEESTEFELIVVSEYDTMEITYEDFANEYFIYNEITNYPLLEFIMKEYKIDVERLYDTLQKRGLENTATFLKNITKPQLEVQTQIETTNGYKMRQLLKGKNSEAEVALEKLWEDLGNNFNIAWYPSAGTDFRDIFELSYNRFNPRFSPDEDIDLFFHTDYCPQYGNLEQPFALGKVDNSYDKLVNVTIEDIFELDFFDEVEYFVDENFRHFAASPVPKVFLLYVSVYSNNTFFRKKPVIYFIFENVNFLDKVLLKNKIQISHLLKVRGGNGNNISVAYAFVVQLGVKYFVSDTDTNTDFELIEKIRAKYNLQLVNYRLRYINGIYEWSGNEVNIFKIYILNSQEPLELNEILSIIEQGWRWLDNYLY